MSPTENTDGIVAPSWNPTNAEKSGSVSHRLMARAWAWVRREPKSPSAISNAQVIGIKVFGLSAIGLMQLNVKFITDYFPLSVPLTDHLLSMMPYLVAVTVLAGVCMIAGALRYGRRSSVALATMMATGLVAVGPLVEMKLQDSRRSVEARVGGALHAYDAFLEIADVATTAHDDSEFRQRSRFVAKNYTVGEMVRNGGPSWFWGEPVPTGPMGFEGDKK